MYILYYVIKRSLRTRVGHWFYMMTKCEHRNIFRNVKCNLHILCNIHYRYIYTFNAQLKNQLFWDNILKRTANVVFIKKYNVSDNT